MAEKINIQQAKSQIYKALGKARQKGFQFRRRLECDDSFSDIRDEVINRLGGHTSSLWWIFFSLALACAVGFGLFAGHTYSTMLNGLLDMSDKKGNIYIILGVCFSIANMIFGHLVSEGFEKNSITGKSSRNLGKSFLGIAGVISMGIFLYMLTSTAAEMGKGEAHLPFLIIFTVIIEAILAAILIIPCRYAKLLLVQISLWFNSKLIGYNARKCDQYFEDYQRYCRSFNRDESFDEKIDMVDIEDENNIRIAITYFRGPQAEHEESANYVNSLDELEDDEGPESGTDNLVEAQINVNDQNGSTNGEDSFNEDDFRI